MRIEYPLPFLNGRNYLHSTTIFNSLEHLIPSKKPFVFLLKSIISTNYIVIEDKTNSDKSSEINPNEAGSLVIHDIKKKYTIVSSRRSSIVRKESNNENRVIKKSHLTDKYIVVPFIKDCSFIETVVFANKLLLSRSLNNDKDGKWFFSRINGNFTCKNYSSIRIEIFSILGSGKIVKSKIFLSDEEWGELYFNWL